MPPGVEYDIKKPVKRKFLSMCFVRGWWTDKDDHPIKEASIGDTIRFHIETEHVDDGDEITFTVYDSDGADFLDDRLSLTIQGTTTDYNKVKIVGNKGFIEWTTGEGSRGLLQENFEGNELELYVQCEYKGNIVSLPHDNDEYLMLYEKEVLITVLIELPHSYYSLGRAVKNFDENEGLSALGLAGHSAMAIGDRYFDYGPDYDLNNDGNIGEVVKISEKDYDYDFNNDGDKDDIVGFQEKKDPANAPGRPWWGEMVANRLRISVSDVKLEQVLDFIKLHWFNDGTNIYGEVHKVEFYINKNEAKMIVAWWEERYKYLKLYSVFPWKGEQCTTAVKLAIQQAFSVEFLNDNFNYISNDTQRPSGLLSELKDFKSTSKKHFNQPAVDTIIKHEAIDYPKKT